MKRLTLCTAIALYGFVVPSHATLILNSDGTVTQMRDDPAYGDGSILMWLEDANYACTSGHDADGLMTWQESQDWIDHLNSVRYAGYSNWRLPRTLPVNGTSYDYSWSYDGSTDYGYNIKSPNSELGYMHYVELGNLGYYDPTGFGPQPGWGLRNTGPFLNMRPQPYEFWSGTESARDPDFAWTMFFGDGGQWDQGLKGDPIYAWAVRDIPLVVGRHVFYNNSAFDGNDPAAGVADDAAVAPDKRPLLPGDTATFDNYTSYGRGINGVMVDINDLPGTPTAEDFLFKAGNDDNPDGWHDAPDPDGITIRPDEGTDGSDRITIFWPDNVIQKQWLQVTVLATDSTGLDEDDVFYFGNAIGEAGDSRLDAKVTVIDMLAARENPRDFLDPAPIDFPYDYNRDARVNATDMLIARNNQTHMLDALQLIAVPGAKGVVPEPSTLVLLAVGAAGLAACTWRWRRGK